MSLRWPIDFPPSSTTACTVSFTSDPLSCCLNSRHYFTRNENKTSLNTVSSDPHLQFVFVLFSWLRAEFNMCKHVFGTNLSNAGKRRQIWAFQSLLCLAIKNLITNQWVHDNWRYSCHAIWRSPECQVFLFCCSHSISRLKYKSRRVTTVQWTKKEKTKKIKTRKTNKYNNIK